MLLSLLRNLRGGSSPTVKAPPPPGEVALLRPQSALPVHVVADHGSVRMEDGLLLIETEESVQEVRLGEVSMLAIHGNVTITTPALREALRRGIPVLFMSRAGYF